jgi:hypothetical protein
MRGLAHRSSSRQRVSQTWICYNIGRLGTGVYICAVPLPTDIQQRGNESLTSLRQRLFCLSLRSIRLTIISPMAHADHQRVTEEGIAQSMPPLYNLRSLWTQFAYQ